MKKKTIVSNDVIINKFEKEVKTNYLVDMQLKVEGEHIRYLVEVSLEVQGEHVYVRVKQCLRSRGEG